MPYKLHPHCCQNGAKHDREHRTSKPQYAVHRSALQIKWTGIMIELLLYAYEALYSARSADSLNGKLFSEFSLRITL